MTRAPSSSKSAVVNTRAKSVIFSSFTVTPPCWIRRRPSERFLASFGVNQKGESGLFLLQLCLRIGSSRHVYALGAVNENALGCYLRLLCLFLAVNDLGGLIGQNLFGLVDVRTLKSAELRTSSIGGRSGDLSTPQLLHPRCFSSTDNS